MFQGSLTALLTPMDAEGRVELERIPALLDHLLDGGTSGVVVAGTTGESATLAPREQETLLKTVVECVAGRVPVLAGTGSADTAEAVTRTRLAAGWGADAALVVTPYYNRPTQAGLEAHYRAVAGAVDRPVVLYNVPSRTAVDLLPETVARLAAVDNIVAIKEAVPGAARARDLLERCGDRLVLLSGDDPTCAEVMLAGARGVISVAANLAPAAMAGLCEAALAGDSGRTADRREALEPLFRQLAVETNPIPVKWGAYELGLAGPGIRLPLVPLSEQHRPALRACLESLGLKPGTDN